ncbi:GlxA family transcriptional regulator [Serratia rubidaea]|uniref:GlxA family transcriptional regulator n=2 Tax=Serratia rubidaea TaxID=61652 RepID=A0ABS0MBW1_SERRU|nr:GlxA family transcriptional regulator [Serratia rubidaea]MBH1929600.1 GlxA family transcriptional regulator [Serratia rubidaea]MDC6118349.1 GlxA family transcriptional regulator [Serratia rubidaea]
MIYANSNDKNPGFSAMARKVGVYIFDKFQMLDMSGPLSAFEIANMFAPGSYDVRVISQSEGLVMSSCGVAVTAVPWLPMDYDTLVIVGGPGASAIAECASVINYVRRASAQVRRLASVCSGAFVLAKTGVLNGRRATTHWNRAAELARNYPKIKVEPDYIYICDGKIWTSAGITAGIDLTLALIGEDLGHVVASQVAQQLVVYFRRPGGYSQKSSLLTAEPFNEVFTELMGWIREHIAEVITVERLACRVAMSPRNFSRIFRREIGVTPAKAIEQIRLEVARERVEQGRDSFEQIAANVGFKSADRMRDAFLRILRESPQSIRHRAHLYHEWKKSFEGNQPGTEHAHWQRGGAVAD